MHTSGQGRGPYTHDTTAKWHHYLAFGGLCVLRCRDVTHRTKIRLMRLRNNESDKGSWSRGGPARLAPGRHDRRPSRRSPVGLRDLPGAVIYRPSGERGVASDFGRPRCRRRRPWYCRG